MPDERVDVVRRVRVAVQLRLGWSIGSTILETGEPGVDAAPPRADQIDEKREIVHARMPFRKQLSFDPLQPPDRLVEQASDLGDVPRDREHLAAEPVADGDADLDGD